MTQPKRIGIYMPAARLERLQHITRKFACSQSRLISAVCALMTDEEVGALLERFKRLEAVEAELGQAANQNLLQFMRGKSVEDLESMLAAARRAA